MNQPIDSLFAEFALSLGLASYIAAFDGGALFGALLGAWLVASTRRRLKGWQRLGSLMLSAGVGYLFTPLVLLLAPFLSSGVAAFVAALVVIPISIKVMVWVDAADLRDIFQRFRRGS